jgi:hypothetical protein
MASSRNGGPNVLEKRDGYREARELADAVSLSRAKMLMRFQMMVQVAFYGHTSLIELLVH